MIHVIRQKQIITPNRLMELIVFEDKDEQLLAAYMKVGLARQPVKLLMGKDYRDFKREDRALANWKKRAIWLPGKKIKIESTLAAITAGYDNDDESLDQMAAEFSVKAIKGLAFVRKQVETRPLAAAKAEVARAKYLEVKEEREQYYDGVEGSGLF
jgi:hypothetical protein